MPAACRDRVGGLLSGFGGACSFGTTTSTFFGVVDDRASGLLVGDINGAVELDPATVPVGVPKEHTPAVTPAAHSRDRCAGVFPRSATLPIWESHTTRPIPQSLRGRNKAVSNDTAMDHHPPHPATTARKSNTLLDFGVT